MASLLASKELARKARDLLIQMKDGPEEAALLKKPAFLIPKPVYDIDPSTQQNPGVPVTKEEQKLADSGELEYTFQVELHIKNGNTNLAVYQQFTNRVIEGNDNTIFLPWYSNDKEAFPEIAKNKSLFQVIQGRHNSETTWDLTTEISLACMDKLK